MQELLEQGSPAELSEAAETLREYSGALAAQGGSLDACLTALRRLTSRQVCMHLTCGTAIPDHGFALLEEFRFSGELLGATSADSCLWHTICVMFDSPLIMRLDQNWEAGDVRCKQSLLWSL